MKRAIGSILAVLVLAGLAASQSDEILKLKERQILLRLPEIPLLL